MAHRSRHSTPSCRMTMACSRRRRPLARRFVVAALIAQQGRNALVLVHRRELLTQWVERLKTFLDIDPKDIGIVGGGRRKPTGIIDVALIQSLVHHGEVSDLVADYAHLVVDECHHLSAASFELVARRAKARYVLGLSATWLAKIITIRSSSCSAVQFDTALMRVRKPPGEESSTARSVGRRSFICHRLWRPQTALPCRRSTLPSHTGRAAQQPHLRRRAEGVGSEAFTGRAGTTRIPPKAPFALRAQSY